MANATQRLSQLTAHLLPSSNTTPSASSATSSAALQQILTPHPSDIVITTLLRTPITKAGRGFLKDTHASDLLTHVLASLLSASNLPPSAIEDVAVGSVLPPGAGATEFRAAAIAAGLPTSTAVKAVNRQCSSGLQAAVDIANAIKSGMIDVGIAAGVESMSMHYGPSAVSEFSPLLDGIKEAADCSVGMGRLSEDMARQYKIPRERQDAFAVRSHEKALKAQREGWFDGEIVPLRNVKYTDPKTEEERTVETVDKDDGIRGGVSAESLGRLNPSFPDEETGEGSIHAGNASPVTDGAAGMILMTRATAERLGQKIVGKYVAASIVGVPPLLMGIGPAKAIPAVLQKVGLKVGDVDVFEINEAFASQCLWCCEELGLQWEGEGKVNPCGGAIALGHPLGCTGVRQVVTLMGELGRRKGGTTGIGRVGVTSMCVGTGMGMAAVWVKE